MRILLSICYGLVIVLYFIYGFDNQVVAGMLVIVAFISMVENIVTSHTLKRHQKVLEWFAEHVHMDPRTMPEDAPEELKVLVQSESEKDRPNKS